MEPEDKSKKQIGIKLADGHFYPVFDEGFHGKKKLVLTTVRDNQENVQIDLFKGSGDVLYEDTYIGSLVIENIGQAPKGVPEIELNIGIDENGNLDATAYDSKSGEKQSLSVSLESVGEEDMYTIPEFEINQEEPTAPSEEEVELQAQTIVEESPQTVLRGAETEKRRGNPLLLVLFILLGLIVIAVAGWGIYAGLKGLPFIPGSLLSAAPAAQNNTTAAPAKETDETSAQVKEEEQEAGQAAAADEQAAVKEETEETAETAKGEEYVIVWGDTLWDISRRYYRDPFQYKMLAKVNKIQNPDLIFAKQKIFIPAK
jgi:LysM repeat protein